MSISVGGKIVTDGLVMHYDALNGRSYPGSGTTWYDLTPYDNTASLNPPGANNPVTIANGYASFIADDAGVNDRFMYVNDINEINNTTGYVTVDMWAKIPSNLGDNNTGNSYLFGFEYYGISFRENNGDPVGKFGFTTENSDTFGIDNLPYITGSLVNKWNHYSFVMCDGNNLSIPSGSQKIYINSNPLSLSQVDGADNSGLRRFSATSNSDMAFGSRRNNTVNRAITYDAALIKVYNRELTQSEVTQNFNAHKGRFNIY
jgi:hypothetical protein